MGNKLFKKISVRFPMIGLTCLVFLIGLVYPSQVYSRTVPEYVSPPSHVNVPCSGWESVDPSGQDYVDNPAPGTPHCLAIQFADGSWAIIGRASGLHNGPGTLHVYSRQETGCPTPGTEFDDLGHTGESSTTGGEILGPNGQAFLFCVYMPPGGAKGSVAGTNGEDQGNTAKSSVAAQEPEKNQQIENPGADSGNQPEGQQGSLLSKGCPNPTDVVDPDTGVCISSDEGP